MNILSSLANHYVSRLSDVVPLTSSKKRQPTRNDSTSQRYCSPVSRCLLKRNYHFHHPVYGRLTVCNCGKKTWDNIIELTIEQRKKGCTTRYSQKLKVRDSDIAHEGKSTLTFEGPLLLDGYVISHIIDDGEIANILNFAASDALHALSAHCLVRDKNIIVGNKNIDLNRLQHDTKSELQVANWKWSDKDFSDYCPLTSKFSPGSA